MLTTVSRCVVVEAVRVIRIGEYEEEKRRDVDRVRCQVTMPVRTVERCRAVSRMVYRSRRWLR